MIGIAEENITISCP